MTGEAEEQAGPLCVAYTVVDLRYELSVACVY